MVKQFASTDSHQPYRRQVVIFVKSVQRAVALDKLLVWLPSWRRPADVVHVYSPLKHEWIVNPLFFE